MKNFLISFFDHWCRIIFLQYIIIHVIVQLQKCWLTPKAFYSKSGVISLGIHSPELSCIQLRIIPYVVYILGWEQDTTLCSDSGQAQQDRWWITHKYPVLLESLRIQHAVLDLSGEPLWVSKFSRFQWTYLWFSQKSGANPLWFHHKSSPDNTTLQSLIVKVTRVSCIQIFLFLFRRTRKWYLFCWSRKRRNKRRIGYENPTISAGKRSGYPTRIKRLRIRTTLSHRIEPKFVTIFHFNVFIFNSRIKLNVGHGIHKLNVLYGISTCLIQLQTQFILLRPTARMFTLN